MPDPQAPVHLIYNALTAGEVTPGLYGRADLAKFHQGAFTMRNFFVDYKGGAKTRPGTQFIGFSTNAGQLLRLWPFKFSATLGQTFILVFSNNRLEFVKNPGGAAYPNGSNAGFVQSSGSNYSISTPYVTADLALLKFSQLENVLTIVHPNYPRYQLTRITDTNWTLTPEMDTVPIAAPTINSVTITTAPVGSTDPGQTFYVYAVTAVDANGNESAPSPPNGGGPGIDIGATLGTVTITWNAVSGAQYYKLYKGLPTSGNVLPTYSQTLGFAGFSYGTTFTDSNVVPDFSKTPLQHNDPFSTGQITGYSITNPGSGYNSDPRNTTIVVTTYPGDPAPITPAVIYPVLSSNVAATTTSGIVGLWIADPGQGYLHPPTLSATSGVGGSGFAGTVTLNPQTGTYPGVVGLFQQREMYADTINQPNTLWGSRSGAPNDFRKRNPVVDDDSIEFTIASPQVTRIVWLQSMPGGLVIGTDSGVVQLTGGSAVATNPLAVTPTSAVIVPQTYFGASDVQPIVINYDILYVQSEGAIVRDLQYNFFVNIYTGTDVTLLSTHLFYPETIVQWAYQDVPNKVIWAVRNDGVMLSLTFLKEQEIIGWARHDTQGGTYESIAQVQEGAEDAVYVSVNRGGQRFVERFAGQVLNSVNDAWCLDAALARSGSPTTAISGLAHLNGYSVMALADGVVQGPFTVSGGAITLTTAASNVVVGLMFQAQLQPLYVDVPGPDTIQGRRKKATAATIRVRDTARIKFGPDFSNLREWQLGMSGTDPADALPYMKVGLYNGDERMVLNQQFNRIGSVAIQQDYPLPCTVLAVIPEIAQGDTR